MHTILLQTKWQPPTLTYPLTPRVRLLHRLTQGIENSLTLLSAPAGYGKTTLLAQWIPTLSPADWHIAWLSLDERDNDPTLFWSYVLTTLNTCTPGISEAALTLLTEQTSLSWEPVLITLINSMSHQEQRMLLILDDYHHIHEPYLYIPLVFLLEHLPSQLRLVLSTRTDPPLPLAQLRARGQLQEIRTEQLRCTTEEVTHFLTQVMQLSLSQDEIQHFEHRAEGWFVGLKLAALSLHQQTAPTHFLASLQGSQRYILDYLTNDVLLHLTPRLQQFLLVTSILEEMCSSLCDAVGGYTDSQYLLEEAERANLFVYALDMQREWYRYHQLFAEALRYRLQRDQPEKAIRELHSRACHWYRDYGRPKHAIHHAVIAQEWDVAVRLDEGVPMEHLLYTLQERWQGQSQDSLPFLDHLLATFPPARLQSKQNSNDVSRGGLNAHQKVVEPLSKRETEVLALLVQGLTNRDIAERLTITVSTVKQHVSSILGKLGATNRSQAQAHARMMDLF